MAISTFEEFGINVRTSDFIWVFWPKSNCIELMRTVEYANLPREQWEGTHVRAFKSTDNVRSVVVHFKDLTASSANARQLSMPTLLDSSSITRSAPSNAGDATGTPTAGTAIKSSGSTTLPASE